MLADSLAKVLGGQGVALQRATSDQALASARAHKPSLLLLAGDAARDRGVLMRARLEQIDKNDPIPVLVIMPPELGGMATQPLPRHVGYLAPSGGVGECARRVQALVELFSEEGLTSCSLQQLADTVSSRSQTTAAVPAGTGTAAVTSPAANKPQAEPAAAARAPSLETAAHTPASAQASQGTQASALRSPETASQSVKAHAAASRPAETAPAPRAASAQRVEPASPRVPDQAARADLAPAIARAEPSTAAKPAAAPGGDAAAPAPSGLRGAVAISSAANPAASAGRDKREASAPSSQTSVAAFGKAAGNTPRASVANSGKAAASAFAGAGVRAQPAANSVRQSPFSKTLLGAPTPGAAMVAASEPETAPREDTGERLKADAGSPPRAAPAKDQAPRRQPPARAQTVDIDIRLALSEAPPDASGAHDAITLAPTVPERTPEASPRKPPARGATVDLDISLTLSDAPADASSAHDAITLAPASQEPQLGAAAPNAKPLRNPFSAGAASPPPLAARAQPPAAEPPALPSMRSRADAAPPALPSARARAVTHADSPGVRIETEPSDARALTQQAAAEGAPTTQPRIRLDAARLPLPQAQAGNAPGTQPRVPLEPRPAEPDNAPRARVDAEPSTSRAAQAGSAQGTQPRVRLDAEQPPPTTQPRTRLDAEQPAPITQPRVRVDAARSPLSAAEPVSASRALATPRATPVRAGLPLESPAWQPPTSQGPARKPTARDILAAPSGPGPAYKPSLGTSPQLEAAEPAKRRRGRWPLYLGLAAVSGAAAVAYWLYLEPGMLGSGRGALGSLQQVPALAPVAAPAAPPTAANVAAPSSGPVATTPADPAAGSAAEPGKSPVPGAQPAAVRGARAAEPTAPATPLAQAKALIDEGNALSAQGHLGLAESAYQKALGVVPEYPVAMTALVRVHLARRDGNEAVRWAKRLVARQDDALAQLLLGDALALRGDLGGAREAWEEAAEGGNATARQRLGN